MRALVLCAVLVAGCKGTGRDDEGAPRSSPPAKRAQGATAEAGPDAAYPTPVGAGTDKIFLLEDPDRGPPVPLAFTPPAGPFTTTTHATCEVDEVTVACGPAEPGRWRVQWRGGAPVIADELRADGTVDRRYVFERDARGALQRRVELDAHGRVMAEQRHRDGALTGRRRDGSNELPGCGSLAYTLDAAGRLAETRCLQWSGQPMHGTDGVAITSYAHDAHGFVVEEVRRSVDRSPRAGNDGIHKVRHERDARGWILATHYAGVDGAPVVAASGCAGRRYERGPRGELLSQLCLDAAGAPKASTQGVALIRYQRDARGCEIRDRSYVSGWVGVVDARGVHGHDLEVDAACVVLRETCVDVTGTAAPCGPGQPARREFGYDELGRLIATRHFDQAGAPAADAAYRVHELRTRLDERDRPIEQACFAPDHHPVECAGTGYHAARATFDEAGRKVEERFVDPETRPATRLGAAVERFRYDNYDHLYERTASDPLGRPVEMLGAATTRTLYDARHQLFGLVLQDATGAPARYTGCFTGATCPDDPWHAVRIVRRPDGTAEANQFFDPEGHRMTTVDCARSGCIE